LTTLEIGRVTKPHGIRGEVKVHLHWSGSTSLLGVERVLLRWPDRERWVRVEHARAADKHVLLVLEGVGDREAAEALRGAAVLVDRAGLPELHEDEYYLADLIGACVVAPSGEVGEVVEVRTHPSVDSLVIRTPAGDVVEQPLVQPWIERVDPAAKRVELSTTDGLIR
jgi:16S rRNA processing protein RimM